MKPFTPGDREPRMNIPRHPDHGSIPGIQGRCLAACGLLLTLTIAGCTPTVKVASPNEPITINLNVKIEHEIRVKVEKDLEEVFSEDSELF